MAHIRFDRAGSSSTTTGTGSLTLGSALTAHRSIQSVASVSDTFHYAIAAVDSNGNETGEWETGVGTYSSTNTMARTTVIASSNSGSAVNFSAGTKRVYITALSRDFTNVVYENVATGSTYTFVAADAGKVKRGVDSSAQSMQVTTAMNGLAWWVEWPSTSGTITLTADGSTSLNGAANGTSVVLSQAGGAVWIFAVGTNAYRVVGSIGDLAPADINFAATDRLLGRSTSGAGTGEEIPCTAAGRALLDDADAAAQRNTLGLVFPYSVALGDETTAHTTGTAKVTFRNPYNQSWTITGIKMSAVTAPTGSTAVVDVNKNGTTILSTKLSLDATELTSITAASQPVLTGATIAADDVITIDIDQVGSTVAGAGFKVYFVGTIA